MKSTLKNPQVVRDYAGVFSYASGFSQGWLRKGKSNFGPVVCVSRSVRGIDEDRPRSFMDTYLGNEEKKELSRLSSQSLDIAKPSVFDISPSSNLTVSLHSVYFGINNAKEEKPYIEVQGDEVEAFRLDVSSIHGSFIADTWFGGCSWTSDENYFVYVAKLKDEKKTSYFTQNLTADITANNGNAAAANGSNKYAYTEDWGEKYEGISTLGFFVLVSVQSASFS